jgi:ketopantoate reductase
MVAGTALSDDPMSMSLGDRAFGPLLLGVARDVLSVAVSTGVKPERFGAFDPEVVASGSETAGNKMLAELSAAARESAKVRSGIWRDMAIRRRPTEVPALFEPVLGLADEHGVSVSNLARLLEVFASIESGHTSRGHDAVMALALP